MGRSFRSKEDGLKLFVASIIVAGLTIIAALLLLDDLDRAALIDNTGQKDVGSFTRRTYRRPA